MKTKFAVYVCYHTQGLYDVTIWFCHGKIAFKAYEEVLKSAPCGGYVSENIVIMKFFSEESGELDVVIEMYTDDLLIEDMEQDLFCFLKKHGGNVRSIKIQNEHGVVSKGVFEPCDPPLFLRRELFQHDELELASKV